MTKVAIVTGASSGLGREFVRQLAEDRDIEEFWVIARRKERLEELQSFCSQKVVPLPLDLCDHGSIAVLKEKLQKEQPDVQVLVCAAGLGKIGECRDLPDSRIDTMIDLNVRACVDVTQACLPYVSKGSRIIEISSLSLIHI